MVVNTFHMYGRTMTASSSSPIQDITRDDDSVQLHLHDDDESTAKLLPQLSPPSSQTKRTSTSTSMKSKRIITLALLRKRSEHNEGLVSSLEELSLHQEELQSIGPILGRTCGKTLKILLLQNNVIERMDPSELKLFRSLEYLNLALNNITKIEGIGGMEWLRKLDLTLNFIDVDALEESVNELSGCRNLEELFLLGNPCMGLEDGGISCVANVNNEKNSSKDKRGWNGCRAYIVARLPNLQYLDGKIIKRSERILAQQQLPSLTSELYLLVQSHIRERQLDNQTQNEYTDEEIDESYISDDAPTTHDPTTRTKISNELYDQKRAKEKQDATHLAPEPKGEKEWEKEHNDVVHKARERERDALRERDDGGGIKQCNQGKYQFWFDEESTTKSGKKSVSLIMRVAIPKHLSTSLVDVDIHPTYVSVVIKSKVIRVVLPMEVLSGKSVARRSAVSGYLELVMPKADPSEGVIGLGHVVEPDGEVHMSTKDCTSSGCSKTKIGSGINRKNTMKKRELLAQKLLNDFGGAHMLKIVQNQGSAASNLGEQYRDDSGDIDDDDDPPPLT